MAKIGSTRLSLRNGGPWGGMVQTSRSAPSRFLLLENCYVNSDGTELRMMPGMRCTHDFETRTRDLNTDTTLGFRATHVDAHRAVYEAVPANAYYQKEKTTPDETRQIWAQPGLMHCIEQVHDRWIMVGESDRRREPIYNVGRTSWVSIAGYQDDGVDITLTLNVQPDTAAGFNTITAGDHLLIDGATGSLATLLNGNMHTVLSFPTATTVKIDTTSGGVVGLTATSAYVARGGYNGRTGGLSDDTFSDLTIWTSLEKGNHSTVTELCRQAHTANRMPDFGDAVGTYKEGNANVATPNGGISRRARVGTSFRSVPHVSGNRLILATPGAGVVMQVPVVIAPSFTGSDTATGIGANSNDIYDRPRCLGVPKAVLWEDPDKSVANSFHLTQPAIPGPGVPDRVFGGNTYASRIGTYQFKFSYVDDGTGEMGLCSEPIVLKTDGANAREGFRFWIYVPGYLMHESLATSINVYRTTRNGQTFYFDRTIPMTGANSTFVASATTSSRYGATPETATTEYFYHIQYDAYFTDDALLVERGDHVPDVLEQMPMGCKASRTIRGFTFFGGALGDAGSRREYFKGSVTLEYDPTLGAAGIYPYSDELTMMFTNDVTAPVTSSFRGSESWAMCGSRIIPPAYAGQSIVGRDVAPAPRKQIDLDKLINTDVSWDLAAVLNYTGRYPDVRYSIINTPLAPTEACLDASRRNIVAYLKLPRARLQISEPDNPNIVPAINTTILANEVDDDIEAIGDAGGQAVICTRAKTYVLGFSQSPLNVPPENASERFGCIAPNSMVSFESSCAWISDRGPVAIIGGAVRWIGEPVAAFFAGEAARYRRDSDGMMRHSWACHDAERSLLYFGVFADRNAGTSLETRITYNQSTFSWEQFRGTASQDLAWSKFPCDEILVYSYRQDRWSVWRPPQPIQWMTRGVDSSGVNRVFVLGQDRRIYVLDDNWAQGDKDTWQITADANQTVSSMVTSLAHIPSWKGMSATVVRTTSGVASIVATATITSETVAGGSTTFGFDAPITMRIGDVIHIGMRSMRVKTTFMNVKQSDSSLFTAGISVALDSRIDSGASGAYEAFVSGSVTTNRLREGIPTKSVQTLNSDDSSHYRWIGRHEADDVVRDLSLVQGQAVGQNHMIDLTITGNAQVRLQDIWVEVA